MLFKKSEFKRLIIGFWVFFLSAGPVTVMAAMSKKHCLALAETDYENIYCQVKYKGLGKGLPAFDEFRENQEWVQASLLKKPAKEAYIVLPKPKKHKKRINAYWWKDSIEKTVTTPSAETQRQPVEITAKPVSETVTTQQARPCQYSVEKITCSQSVWQLQVNKSNRQLASGVLNDANSMGLPKKNGQPANQYLTQVYPIYIKKMLDIGLGGSTMAYTRFVRVYEEGQKQGLVFNERFEKMYTLLKKERQVMGVSSKVPKNFMPSAKSCFVWQQNLMTCDNKQDNLVYLKP